MKQMPSSSINLYQRMYATNSFSMSMYLFLLIKYVETVLMILCLKCTNDIMSKMC